MANTSPHLPVQASSSYPCFQALWLSWPHHPPTDHLSASRCFLGPQIAARQSLVWTPWHFLFPYNVFLLSFSYKAWSFLLLLFWIMWFLLISRFVRHLIHFLASWKVCWPSLVSWHVYGQPLRLSMKVGRKSFKSNGSGQQPLGPPRADSTMTLAPVLASEVQKPGHARTPRAHLSQGVWLVGTAFIRSLYINPNSSLLT